MTVKPGDVVVLKSGGPEMTVVEFGSNLAGDVTVKCSWFDKDNKHQSVYFNPDALTLVDKK